VPATPALPTAPDPGQLLSVTARPGNRPGSVVIEVTGEIDTSTVPLLELCLDSQSNRRDLRELVVDLEQVTFLGVVGVAALARAHRRCGPRGVRLVVQCAGRRRVLDRRQLTELAGLASIDREDADPRPTGRRTAIRPWPGGPRLSRAAAASTATAARLRP